MQPPFPTPAAAPFETPARLVDRGFALRNLHGDDERWLRDLYASTREEELAAVPWPPAMRRAFCDQQFDLQHRHFVVHYPLADFLAIEHGDAAPVGRFYIDRSSDDLLVIDVALFPQFRGGGVGHALLAAAQEAAAASGGGVRLHVANHNTAARRLYERCGFVGVETGPTHLQMRWRAMPVS